MLTVNNNEQTIWYLTEKMCDWSSLIDNYCTKSFSKLQDCFVCCILVAVGRPFPTVRSYDPISSYSFINLSTLERGHFFLLKLTAYFSSTPFQINETVNNRRSIYVREDHRRYTLHVCYPPFYTDLYAYVNRLLRLQIWNKHLVNGWDNSIIVY